VFENLNKTYLINKIMNVIEITYIKKENEKEKEKGLTFKAIFVFCLCFLFFLTVDLIFDLIIETESN
jgi:hypothetical protein